MSGMKQLALIGLLIVVFLALNAHIERISAEELFGEGMSVSVETDKAEIGLITAKWPDGQRFVFAFAGLDRSGYIVQVFGQRMQQYGPYQKSNQWAFYYERRPETSWLGRIEFRGHFRPFCGGNDIPKNCMWK